MWFNSSAPSNTPEPFHGPRFPIATIRDNVEAVHRLLVDSLRITHLKAVIGFSMGAEQAFQWAVSYPDFSDRIVATAGTARCWPHGIVRLEAGIESILLDPAFKGGDYTSPPKQGVAMKIIGADCLGVMARYVMIGEREETESRPTCRAAPNLQFPRESLTAC